MKADKNLFGNNDVQTIRTLAKYYPLNKEAGTFEMALHYEKASDLFEENADNLEQAPRISESITDRMSEMLDDIPNGYSADVSIRVDDYEGYTSEQLMGGLKDTLFLRHRRFLHEETRNGLKTGSLIVAGIVMILILTIGRQIGWWGGDDTVSEILTYMLDTLGCVLIWEGLYMAFLEVPEEFVFEQKISHKISSIRFYQDDGDRAAVSESRENLSALMEINRKELFAKRMLLFSGSSVICVTVAWVLQSLGIIINPEVFGEKVTAELILDLVTAPLYGAAGVLSLRAYEGKQRNLPVFLVFAAVILYTIVYYFVMLLRQGSAFTPTQTILAIFIIVTGLTFLVGCGMYYIQQRRRARAEA